MNQNYLLLAVVVLGFILEMIIAYKLSNEKKHVEKFNKKLEAEFTRTKKHLDDILDTTTSETQEIISQSLEQYKSVHTEIRKLTDHVHEKIEDVAQEIVQWQAEELTSQIETHQEHLNKLANDSADFITKATSKEIEELQGKLAVTISQTQELIQDHHW
jgi:gas vesicle protein